MKSLEKNKSVVIAVIIFVMVMFAYRTFFKPADLPPVDFGAFPAEVEANQVAGRELVELFNVLRSVTLRQELFASPLYRSLVDFSVELVPQQPGRSNPFAQIGND
jgi:hypothetical protein